ncbi:MAG: DNA polymerase III subunit gamma/tau, partial [Burkholderiaceae bacterium]|nr:DNA polymerase III subunit gamma/tau [Burkholderiaceae bacterium]
AAQVELPNKSIPPSVNGTSGATKIVAIPVRDQAGAGESDASSRLAPAEGAALQAGIAPSEDGDFWHAMVRRLIVEEAVTALVRELALQSQLVARDIGDWLLRVERESLNQPTARERLQNALLEAGHPVRLTVEVGRVTDSPARRNAQAAAEKQRAAEAVIQADPFVQAMMRDFGAKIVPGSIKPL